MINTLFDDLFGNLNLGEFYDLCVFFFGCLCFVGTFQVLKLMVRTIFKRN